MIYQNVIWLIALLGIGVVTLGFVYVIARASKPVDPAQAQQVQQKSSQLRRGLFLALLVLGAGVAYGTLEPFPIPNQNAPLQAPQVVDVVAHQWYWELSKHRLRSGVPVEFRVTSADVNHDFAIYAPNGRIVIQTQAMPGFTNKLLHTFRQPGTYRILCLEYCGLAHHRMLAEIKIVAAAKGGNHERTHAIPRG